MFLCRRKSILKCYCFFTLYTTEFWYVALESVFLAELIIKHLKTDRGGNRVHAYSSHSEEDYSVWHGHRPHKEVYCCWLSGSQHQVCLFSCFSSFFLAIICIVVVVVVSCPFVHLLVKPVFQEIQAIILLMCLYHCAHVFLYLYIHECVLIPVFLQCFDSFMKAWLYRQVWWVSGPGVSVICSQAHSVSRLSLRCLHRRMELEARLVNPVTFSMFHLPCAYACRHTLTQTHTESACLYCLRHLTCQNH